MKCLQLAPYFSRTEKALKPFSTLGLGAMCDGIEECRGIYPKSFASFSGDVLVMAADDPAWTYFQFDFGCFYAEK